MRVLRSASVREGPDQATSRQRPRVGHAEPRVRDPAVRKDCGNRRPEATVAQLPREMAELAFFPAVPPGWLRDHGEGVAVAAEQPVTPDGSEVRAGVIVERDRRKDSRVEIDHREPPPRQLEQLELEDALPADRGEQLAHLVGQARRWADRLRVGVHSRGGRPEPQDARGRGGQQPALGEHARARQEAGALEALDDEGRHQLRYRALERLRVRSDDDALLLQASVHRLE